MIQRFADVHPYYTRDLKGVADLVWRMQSFEDGLAKTVTKEAAHFLIDRHRKRLRVRSLVEAEKLVIARWILVAEDFSMRMYHELKKDLERHALRYPMRVKPQLSIDDYNSLPVEEKSLVDSLETLDYTELEERKKFFESLNKLRKIPKYRGLLKPRKITQPIPLVFLPGINFEAKTFVEAGVFEKPFKKKSFRSMENNLSYQREEHDGDYHMGVAAFTDDIYEPLMNAWLYGVVQSQKRYQDPLYAIEHEEEHCHADQLSHEPAYEDPWMIFEHVWLQNVGLFPARVRSAVNKNADLFVGALARDIDYLNNNGIKYFKRKRAPNKVFYNASA